MNGDTKVSTQDKGPSSALGRDLLLLVDFPPAARERLWSILGPCVSEKLPDDLDEQIQAFERAFELQPTALPRVLRACRLLVRGAALRGLDASAVQTDALALTGSDEPGRVHGVMQRTMGQVLPRSAASAATWAKIVARFGARFAPKTSK